MWSGGIIRVRRWGGGATRRGLKGPLKCHQAVITAQTVISAAWPGPLLYSRQERAKQPDYNLYKYRCRVCVRVRVCVFRQIIVCTLQT